MNRTGIKYVLVAWLAVGWMTIGSVSHAQTSKELLAKANSLFNQGLTEEARQVHEKLIGMDTACVESNVWLGNYYYLRGEEKRKQAEAAYRTLPYPSSMQSAYYQEQLKSICKECHLRADTLVQRALRRQPNDHLQSIAAEIEAYKIKLGFAKPPVAKKSALVKLFKSSRDSTVLP